MKKQFLFATWCLLIGVSLVAAVYGSVLLWDRYRPAKFEELASVEVAVADELPGPVSISFPRITLQVPVVRGQITDNQWSTAEDAASFVNFETANGSGWIIYGHNYPRILGELDGAKVGDTVVMTLSDGSQATFEITEKILVYPEYTDSIIPSDSEPLVIYTCTGFLDSKRLVVRARQVE